MGDWQREIQLYDTAFSCAELQVLSVKNTAVEQFLQ